MSVSREEELRMEAQKRAVFHPESDLEVIQPCRIGEGIVPLDFTEKEQYIQRFKSLTKSLCFFIPASGSGSRMFQFLYEFLEKSNESNQAKTERFFSQITSFALFKKLPLEIQEKVLRFEMNVEEFIPYLLEIEGLNFGQLPKGLIPFHFNSPFLLNPFQEQLIQGSELTNAPVRFHFTIQSIFEKEFQESIELLKQMTGRQYDVTYSEQDPQTNSYVFDEQQQVVLDEDGKKVMRPAGHGTLLSNLEKMDADYVLVKNIDNLQHFTKSKPTNVEWEMLVGVLDELKEALEKVYRNPSKSEFEIINQRFQLIRQEELDAIETKEEIQQLVNRPIRICGMVRNEGQPGGGPFFVRKNGQIRKQIVEKSQLVMQPNASNLMVQSTHFNPVMMALSLKDFDGKKYQLNDFKDTEGYFILEKSYRGKNVRFLEYPGLWNGGMAYWNTVFVEIPNDVFTPVKTVLDLLHPAHQSI
ncbi:MAG: DUF4301 family protein [Flavobacteriales bacterium]